MLKFTGIGSAYHPEYGSNSAYFVAENVLYILDCGESVFGRMKSLGLDFNSFDQVVFLMTHMHSDHIGSLAGFVSYLSHVEDQKPLIVHPVAKISTYLSLCGINEDEYRFEQTEHFTDQQIKVDFYPVEHVNNMEAFGMHIQIPAENYSFYYSGDAKTMPAECLHLFNEREIDEWYQDVTVDPNNRGHYYYERAFTDIRKERLAYFYCMHLEENAEEILEKAGLHRVQAEILPR